MRVSALETSPQRIPRSLFPKLRDQHCPRHGHTVLSLVLFLCLSLSLSLLLCLSYVSFARRKRSNSPVSRERPCIYICIRAHVCARPVTRINPVHPHVKCTVKRKWPLCTGEPPLPLSSPSRYFLSALSSAI